MLCYTNEREYIQRDVHKLYKEFEIHRNDLTAQKSAQCMLPRLHMMSQSRQTIVGIEKISLRAIGLKFIEKLNIHFRFHRKDKK